MINIKITKKDLKEIIDIVTLEGKDSTGNKCTIVESFILNVDKVSKIAVVTEEGDLSLIVEINVPHQGSGKIPINISDINTTLARFGNNDEIELSYNDKTNIMLLTRLKPKLSYPISCIDISTISSTLTREIPIIFDGEIPTVKIDDNEIRYKTRIDLDAKELKEAIGDSPLLNIYTYPLSLVNNNLEINSKNDINNRSVEREIVCKVKYFDKEINFTNVYGSNFTNIITSLTGDIRLYMCDGDLPLIIKKNSKVYNITAFLTTLDITEDVVGLPDGVNIQGID
jgi:hypothetical protein